MTNICVLGSINKDIVYQVDQFVRAKETITSNHMEEHLGGKGLNQAIALSRAYDRVFLCGNIGIKDEALIEQISNLGVNTKLLSLVEEDTGSAFIQVDNKGENCIVLYKGANHQFTREGIDYALAQFNKGDLILVQNEINQLDYIISKCHELGLTIALNPSPFEDQIKSLPLHLLDYILINEVEGQALSGKSNPKEILSSLEEQYPNTCIVLTLGAEGVLCSKDGVHLYQKSQDVEVVDTTAAGDTFTGYFLATLLEEKSILEALEIASFAAGISVSRRGAAESIPRRSEVETELKKREYVE